MNKFDDTVDLHFRCHDSSLSGQFHRSYFQCDPMKVFIQSTNKCDYVYVIKNSTEICSSAPNAQENVSDNSIFNGTNTEESVSRPTSTGLAPSDSTQIFPGDRPLSDSIHDFITPVNSPPSGAQKCRHVQSECEMRRVCWPPHSAEFGNEIRICKKLYRMCTSPEPSKTEACSAGTVYYPKDFYCMSGKIYGLF